MLRATHNTILFIGLLWGTALSSAQVAHGAKHQLHPGIPITLKAKATPAKGKAVKPTTQERVTLQVNILAAGEYILQTTGDTDTYCRLFDRTSGQIAADNNSGEAKNCRIVTRLGKGTYRLQVRREQRALKVSLEAYSAQGGTEDIADGAIVRDTLRAGQFRTFRLKLKRRRMLALSAQGTTLRHCRLFNDKGWPTTLTTNRTYRRRILRRTRRRFKSTFTNVCQLQGILEPGTYLLHTYGHVAALTKAKQAPLQVYFGARKLQPSRWRTFYLRKGTKQRYWFRLPSSNEDQTLVIEAKTLTRSYGTWRITVGKQSWTQSSPTYLGSCSGHRKKHSCTFVKKVKAGERMTLSFYTYKMRKLKFRYYSFTHADTATLGKPAQQLALRGQMSQIKFQVKRAGPHWIQVQPPVKSCVISRTDQPLHKRLALARGIPLKADATKTLGMNITKQGRTFFFQVPRAGVVTFESTGSIDTYCQLSSWHGDKIEVNDDGGPGRNCRIQRQLKAGIYRMYVRIYRGPRHSWLKFEASHRSDNKKAKLAEAIQTGCAFVGNLQPGNYKLESAEATKTGPRFTYIIASKRKRKLRLSTAKSPRSIGLLPPTLPQAARGTDWQRWFTLARHQTHTFSWRVPQTGFYTIQSLGHILPSCRLLNTRASLRSVQLRGASKNCRFTQYLTKGTYQLQVQALGRTQGPIGLQVKRRRVQALGALQYNQRKFALLNTDAVGQLDFKATASTTKTSKNIVGLISLDAALRCTVFGPQGWPGRTRTCLLTLPSKAGKWRIFVHTSRGKARLGILAKKASSSRYLLHTRRSASRLRKDPNKAIPLHLNRNTRGQISVLGWDAYTFKLESKSLIQLRLPAGFKARLFRNKTFVEDIGPAAPKMPHTKAALALKAGQYRLVVRHKDGGPHHSYNLAANVLAASPGARFYVPTPTTLLINIEKRGHVDIGTIGIVDTWCSLEDSRGELLQRNDDQSVVRWDCKLSRLLDPGQYKLRIGGKSGSTILSIRRRKALTLAALSGAKQPVTTLPARQVHARSYTTKRLELATFVAQSKTPLGCILESKGRVLQRSTGTTCRINHLCRPGTYTWRIHTQSGVAASYQPSLEAAALPQLAKGGALKLPFDPKSPSRVALQVAHTGPYKLSLQGISSPKQTSCSIAFRGHVRTFGCQQPLQLSAGEHHLTIASENKSLKKPETLQLSLQEAPLSPGQTRRVEVATAETFQMPFVAPQTGIYALAVKSDDDRRWGCQLLAQHAIANMPTSRHKCHFVLRLAKGQHTLRMWRPTGYAAARGNAQAAVTMVRLKEAKKDYLSANVHSFERTMKAHQARGFRIPLHHPMQVRILLHGHGVAYLTQGNLVVGSCVAHGTTQCTWITAPSPQPLDLNVVPGAKPLHFRASLRGLRAPVKTKVALPNSSQFIRLTRNGSPANVDLYPTRSKKALTLEVRGATRCVLFGAGPAFREGCKQALKAGSPRQQLMIYGRRMSLLALYQQGKRAAALWGAKGPTKQAGSTKAAVLTHGSGVHPLTSAARAISWHQIRATAGSPLRLTASGRHLACALFTSKSRLITSSVGRRTCRIERILQAGIYWLGVRHQQGRPVRGALRIEKPPAARAKQGTSGPYLLGPGKSRWFGFHARRTGLVGIGAVDQHDSLQCRLFDAKQRFITKGCQIHRKLTAGQYLLQVKLPKGRRAALLKLVLRGLNPPAARPPRAFLKKIKRESVNND